MRSVFWLSGPVLALAWGMLALANEKPTKEFQDVMTSNGSIIDVSFWRDDGDARRPVQVTGLREHIRAKDYNAIAMDAATLKTNFEKILAFWTEKKVDDAINWSKMGLRGATDLGAAAQVKDDAAVRVAQAAIVTTCQACHQAHRVRMVTDMEFQIR